MRTGEKWTDEHRKKMNIIFNNPEYRERRRKRFIGKGNPMYGRPITDEHRRRLVESHLGQIAWNKGKCYPQITGINNGNWKGGTSLETHKRLNDFKWLKIANEIRKRDNYTCQICGRKHCSLDVHHIIPYRITQNNDSRNLVTLCKSCHAKIDLKINMIFIMFAIIKGYKFIK